MKEMEMKKNDTNESVFSKQIAIVITTYNCPKHIDGLLQSIQYQNYTALTVVIADDGSTDDTNRVIKGYMPVLKIRHLELEHGERGLARFLAIEEAKKVSPDYLMIIDADMVLKKGLLHQAVTMMEENESVDGMIIPEIPFSNYNNFFTKVKLFERKIINGDRLHYQKNSIEAARFWKMSSYLKTGGIHKDQIAFEEIQPTLRCLENGGTIGKIHGTGMFHDEKKVTLFNILTKKNYYFSKLSITAESEKNGWLKAVQRWYLFRPVYYQPSSIIEYIKHPLLFLGMVIMYVALTGIAVYQILKSKLSYA